MNFWQALILGLVQGATEFLPISSSGHLALFQQWFAIQEPTLIFDVFLHAASLVAIGLFFWSEIKKLGFKDYWLLGIGTLPAVVIGLWLEDIVDTTLAGPIWLGVSFLMTAGINFAIHHLLKKPVEEEMLTTRKAFIIGAWQAFAIIPAVSRSGSTLLGGLSQKLNKEKAFAFTFLLGIPAILGANILQAARLFSGSESAGFSWQIFMVGGLASLVASLYSLKLLKQFLVRSRFASFGWYCLLLGTGLLLVQII